MKIKPILRAMTLLATALALAAGLWGVAPAVKAATTYYSQGNLAPNLTTSWNTVRTGGGTSPANFTSGDVFVIQNGHNMTTSAVWTVSGTGATIQIESGGVLTANDLVSVPTFRISESGTYVHNVTSTSANGMGSDIPGSTARIFAASSTVEIQRWANGGTIPTPLPSGVSWGNLTINVATLGGSWNQTGDLTTILGNFTILATGGTTREFRLIANVPSIVTINIGGDLTISGGILNLTSGSAAPTINIGGSFNQTGGTFISTGSGLSTIVFTGGSSSVTFSTSGGTFTNNNINWQIAAGKTVGLNTNFGAGSWVNAARTMTVNGAFQINQGAWPGNGGAWSYGAAGSLIYNNNSGSYGVGNDTYWPTSNGPVNVNVLGSGGITMNVARTVNGTFQTAAGVINGHNLTLNGTAQINTFGYFNTSPTYGAGSTLVYNPGGSYQIGNEWREGSTVGGGVPQHITVQNGTSVSIWTGARTRTVTGNFTISSGSLTLGGNIGDDFVVGGNWTNNGAFNANSRAVTFNGAGVQTIGGSSATAFDYLIVNSGATVVIPTSNTPTVNTVLTNNGALRQTRDLNNSNAAFLNISANKYYGVVMTTTANMGATTVTVYGNQACANATNPTVLRCYDISPTTPAAAVITFYYLNTESHGQTAPDIWHWNGALWDKKTVSARGATGAYGWLTATGIDSYSDFAAGDGPPGPTAVTLAAFTATPQAAAVRVAWETASELDNVGFNLYRSATADGPYTRLNATLIPPQNPGSVLGGVYEWLDADAQPGVTYFYKLEDLDVKGVSTFHGPVSSASFSAPAAVGLRCLSARGLFLPLTVGGACALGLAVARRRKRKN